MNFLSLSEARRWCAVGWIAAFSLCLASSASAQTLDAAWTHSLVAKADGTVLAFGNNGKGQLGDGTTITRTTPVTIGGLTGVVAVAAGQEHSMALTSDGRVWAWGSNAAGQLGRHYEWEDMVFDYCTPCRPSPVLLDLQSVVAIAAGSDHSLALLANGDVYGWGNNYVGAYGASISWSDAPLLVMTGAAAISAGPSRSVILKADGTVWGSGWNQEGALGDGTYAHRDAFVQMSGVAGAAKVAAGGYHTLVLLDDGTLKAVGYNAYGGLGDRTWMNQNLPVTVGGMADVVEVAAGSAQSYALKSNGTVWSWGRNDYGELGDGTTQARIQPRRSMGSRTSSRSLAGMCTPSRST